MKILLFAFAFCFINAAAFSQNVGIGTATPTKAGLQVDKAVGATYAMFGSQTTGVAIEAGWPGIGLNTYYNGGRKYIANGYSGLISMDPVSGGLSFFVSPQGTKDGNVILNTGLKVFPSGNVGIGTNPSGEAPLAVMEQVSKVAVFGNTANLDLFQNTGIYLKTGSYYTGALMTLGENTQTARLSLLTFSSTDHTQLKERLSIMDDGNVGIGTNNPSAKLQVNGTFKLVNGSQGADKVLVSDATGNATWKSIDEPFGKVSLYKFNNPRFGLEAIPVINGNLQFPFAVSLNAGSSWDNNNNTYTAPKTGYYSFNYKIFPYLVTSYNDQSYTVYWKSQFNFYGGGTLLPTMAIALQRYIKYSSDYESAPLTASGVIFLQAAQTIQLSLTYEAPELPSAGAPFLTQNSFLTIHPL